MKTELFIIQQAVSLGFQFEKEEAFEDIHSRAEEYLGLAAGFIEEQLKVADEEKPKQFKLGQQTTLTSLKAFLAKEAQ